MNVVDDVECPARKLALHFMGPARRTLAPHLPGNLHPSAETTPMYHKSILSLHRELLTMDPTVDVRGTQPARLCELVVKRAAQRVEPPEFPWKELALGNLPDKVKDFQWQRAWRILPTKDRLFCWGITDEAACPDCRCQETTEHAVSTCVVARCFWRILQRVAPGMRLAQYHAGNRCPREAMARLCLALGECVLWRNRSKVVAQNRRLRLQWPLLCQFRQELRVFLSGQLFWLGEEEFLRRWSCQYLQVINGRVQVKIEFPHVLT